MIDQLTQTRRELDATTATLAAIQRSLASAAAPLSVIRDGAAAHVAYFATVQATMLKALSAFTMEG